MTGTAHQTQRVGAREAGRRLGVSHSYLLRLAKADRLPRSADGTFDVEECRRILAATTDVAQVRTVDPDRWSQGRSRLGHPVNGHHLPPDHKPGDLKRIPADPPPDAADYRARTDLDAFAAGALFGAHRVAFEVPNAAAQTVLTLGLNYDRQREAYLIERAAAHLLISDVLRAVGLEAPEDGEPNEHAPTLFLGLGPLGGVG